MQIAEFAFTSTSGAKLAVAQVSNPGGRTPSKEKPEKLIDGSSSTKWLDFNKKASRPLPRAVGRPWTVGMPSSSDDVRVATTPKLNAPHHTTRAHTPTCHGAACAQDLIFKFKSQVRMSDCAVSAGRRNA